MKFLLRPFNVYMPLYLCALSCFACDADQQPSIDDGITTERICNGIDDDSDGKIDEGLLNACLGCIELNQDFCTLTSIMLQSKTTEPVVPVPLQYRIYEPEERQLSDHRCTFERIQSVQPIVLDDPITLSQGIPPQQWSSDPELIEDTFAGFVLDGVSPIVVDVEGTDLTFTLNPPSPPSASSRLAVERCVNHFDDTVEMPSQLVFEEATELFVGGSTLLASGSDETATSFFVLSGKTQPDTMPLNDLVAARPYVPDAVRCSISNSVQSSRPKNVNGYQVSAQTSVDAALSRNPMTPPELIRDFQSIIFTSDQVQVNLTHLDLWGPPDRMDFSRSGSVDGMYESQRITCELDPQSENLVFSPDTVLPPWQGVEPPQDIVRLQWSETRAPFSSHPEVMMREALTIQRNRTAVVQ